MLEVAKAEELNGTQHEPGFIASLHALLGENDEAFKWIAKAIDAKDDSVDLLKVDPSFDSLHSDPRWPELLRRINLTP